MEYHLLKPPHENKDPSNGLALPELGDNKILRHCLRRSAGMILSPKQYSSSIKSRLPSKVVFHQRSFLGLSPECGIAQLGPYVVRFIFRDSPYIVHFKCRDNHYIVHF